jgi:hypothetical protein
MKIDLARVPVVRNLFPQSAGEPTRLNCMRRLGVAVCFVLTIVLSVMSTGLPVQAQASRLPDVVKLPTNLDTGGSSFYDGFGRTNPGFIFLNFARWNHLTSIKDTNGHSSPLFASPRIDVFNNLFHIVYVSPIEVPDGALTFEVLMPVTGFQSKFGSSGLSLHDGGWNVGDLTFGADYQSRIRTIGQDTILSYRAGLDFLAPTGKFDSRLDLNQGAGFWSIAPYLAVTLLPVPKWEMSARITYDYNFSTTRGSNPPPIPGFSFVSGQAGQAIDLNFASSYELWDGIRPGINGFWLQQLNDDKTNGIAVQGSLQEQLFVGPGLSWQTDQSTVMNFNLYLPAHVANAPSGTELNWQVIQQF